MYGKTSEVKHKVAQDDNDVRRYEERIEGTMLWEEACEKEEEALAGEMKEVKGETKCRTARQLRLGSGFQEREVES